MAKKRTLIYPYIYLLIRENKNQKGQALVEKAGLRNSKDTVQEKPQTLKTIFKKFRWSKKDPFPVWNQILPFPLKKCSLWKSQWVAR